MRFKPTLAALSLAVAAVMTGAPAAHAAIINFNGLAGTAMPGAKPPFPGVFTVFDTPSTVSGYTFTTAPVAQHHWPSSHWYASPINSWLFCGGSTVACATNGTDYLLTHTMLTVQRADNAAFTLAGFELAAWEDSSTIAPSQQYLLSGTRMDNSVVTQVLTLDNLFNADGDDDFNQFNFTHFNNLASFSIVARDGEFSSYALDNLNVTAADTEVPEPGVPAMLMAGAAAMLWKRRRNKAVRPS